MEELFESRRDIETLMLIVKEWQEEHPSDSKEEYANQLYNKLDCLHMVW